MKALKGALPVILTMVAGMIALWLSGHNFERSVALAFTFIASLVIGVIVGVAVYSMGELSK